MTHPSKSTMRFTCSLPRLATNGSIISSAVADGVKIRGAGAGSARDAQGCGGCPSSSSRASARRITATAQPAWIPVSFRAFRRSFLKSSSPIRPHAIRSARLKKRNYPQVPADNRRATLTLTNRWPNRKRAKHNDSAHDRPGSEHNHQVRAHPVDGLMLWPRRHTPSARRTADSTSRYP